ncbi:MAG: protein kinase [Muribaculaceae bacterium]|nr:protein kinase [Muribaculaceae bacterium]
MDNNNKWTEIEHLPQWDEEYYLVYTAKKYGKWVMLKTLRPEYANLPEYQQMIDKEFDTRYNLSHPNIVMINDLEDVPGVGRSIITDDVYGLSLRKLLDENKLEDKHFSQLLTRLPAAMEYIQQNHIAHHPIRPETIIFTENIGNLKLIDVGFDHRKSLAHESTDDDIFNYGSILREVLERTGRRDPRLLRIAEHCVTADPKQRFHDIQGLQIALSGQSSKKLYMMVVGFLGLMVVILAMLLIFNPAN